MPASAKRTHAIAHRTSAQYVRVAVRNARNTDTTISLKEETYAGMLRLARGSGSSPVQRVRQVLRGAADALRTEGYVGEWSKAVRSRAGRVLAGTYRPDLAAEYDAAQFPDGTPVSESSSRLSRGATTRYPGIASLECPDTSLTACQSRISQSGTSSAASISRGSAGSGSVPAPSAGPAACTYATIASIASRS